MYTIMLYVMICTSPTQCDSYEPESWSVSTYQEEQLAFEQCADLERQSVSVQGYKESDCYYVE